MATKTISLTLEAYERLRRVKRHPSESFSDVVMRARWEDEAITGGEFLTWVRERGPVFHSNELDAIEEAKAADRPAADKWESA